MKSFEKILQKIIPKNFFSFHENVLTFQGLLSPKHPCLRILYLIWSIPHNIFTTVYLISVEIIMAYQHYETNRTKAMVTIAVIFLHMVCSKRIFIWHFFLKKKYNRIINILKRDVDFLIFNVNDVDLTLDKPPVGFSYECIKEYWQRKTRFYRKLDKYNRRNEIEDFKIRNDLHVKFQCLCIQLTFFMAVFLVIFNAYLIKQPRYYKFNPKLNVTSLYSGYPFETYFPFDTSITDGYYLMGQLYQIYMYIGCVETFLILDTSAWMYMWMLKGQLTTVRFALRKLDCDIKVKGKKASLLIVEMRMIKCIEEVKFIIKGVQILEQLYNVQLAIQYGMCVLIICFTMYAVQLITSVGELSYLFSILVLILFEPLFISWISQSLTEEIYDFQCI
ncbi:uncharacterized protein LOC109595611 isoform X3 [Aethina tumida]|uniref:uncharacterized protein LOC109595611 isoform X3 n=1 Tax=Aethina tumida TaxID=116153 RepID=UPI0021496ED8|nr:uncharacterized protein LOC109595611 isoform X3 [Aethina tumida]